MSTYRGNSEELVASRPGSDLLSEFHSEGRKFYGRHLKSTKYGWKLAASSALGGAKASLHKVRYSLVP